MALNYWMVASRIYLKMISLSGIQKCLRLDEILENKWSYLQQRTINAHKCKCRSNLQKEGITAKSQYKKVLVIHLQYRDSHESQNP